MGTGFIDGWRIQEGVRKCKSFLCSEALFLSDLGLLFFNSCFISQDHLWINDCYQAWQVKQRICQASLRVGWGTQLFQLNVDSALSDCSCYWNYPVVFTVVPFTVHCNTWATHTKGVTVFNNILSPSSKHTQKCDTWTFLIFLLKLACRRKGNSGSECVPHSGYCAGIHV